MLLVLQVRWAQRALLRRPALRARQVRPVRAQRDLRERWELRVDLPQGMRAPQAQRELLVQRDLDRQVLRAQWVRQERAAPRARKEIAQSGRRVLPDELARLALRDPRAPTGLQVRLVPRVERAR